MPILTQLGKPSDSINAPKDSLLRKLMLDLLPFIGGGIIKGINNETISLNDTPKYLKVKKYAEWSEENCVKIAAILGKQYSNFIISEDREFEDIPDSEIVNICINLIPEVYEVLIEFSGLSPV